LAERLLVPGETHARREVMVIIIGQGTGEPLWIPRRNQFRRIALVDYCRNAVVLRLWTAVPFPTQSEIKRQVRRDSPVVLDPRHHDCVPEMRREDIDARERVPWETQQIIP